MIRQREIIEVPFFNAGSHPALIVSSPDILLAEGYFYALLMSPKNIYTEFNFPYTLEMIHSPKEDMNPGFIICHQLQIFFESEIVSRSGSTLKAEYFKQVIAKVNEGIFDLDSIT